MLSDEQDCVRMRSRHRGRVFEAIANERARGRAVKSRNDSIVLLRKVVR